MFRYKKNLKCAIVSLPFFPMNFTIYMCTHTIACTQKLATPTFWYVGPSLVLAVHVTFYS